MRKRRFNPTCLAEENPWWEDKNSLPTEVDSATTHETLVLKGSGSIPSSKIIQTMKKLPPVRKNIPQPLVLEPFLILREYKDTVFDRFGEDCDN
ncbi:hypothetical protein PGB90_007530 [Kerria lacca]